MPKLVIEALLDEKDKKRSQEILTAIWVCFQGMDEADAAERLDVTMDALKVMQRAGLQRIRLYLDTAEAD